MKASKLKTSKEEYLFIRQEILQYLNNYQSVRNMMYGSTLSCLGLGIFFEDKIAIGVQYLFLLPLIVQKSDAERHLHEVLATPCRKNSDVSPP